MNFAIACSKAEHFIVVGINAIIIVAKFDLLKEQLACFEFTCIVIATE
jgi:hypothetical protein